MRFVILLIMLALVIVSCDTDERPVEVTVLPHAPGAPPKNLPDEPDIPIEWTTHNLRIEFIKDTPTHILAWVRYEIDGTQSVVRRILIPKSNQMRRYRY